jgi:23S rRNA (adenine2503-C2)-methyltransferase
MQCAFCATGAGGFERNLSTGEIVGQICTARFALQHAVDNVVFMGMGEPFDNFENVMQAVGVISDQRGLNIPQSRITISTVGHGEGIARFAKLGAPRPRLAVSINAADDTVRAAIMPITRQYPLADLRQALLQVPLKRGDIIFIEYVLLAGINDSPLMAHKLAHYCEGLPVRVNLIAYNRNESLPFVAPTPQQVNQFRDWLVAEKLFVRIRESQGEGIGAACGQLRALL